MDDSIWQSSIWIEHASSLLRSYHHWVGRDLVDSGGDAIENARRLWNAPFVVVAHGGETDPILCYGNRSALQLWEMTPDEFTRTPSRLTAEPMHRDERARLLAETRVRGYVDHYQGIRISRSGKRFRIHQAVVWNIISITGEVIGQAASFASWQDLPAVSAMHGDSSAAS